MKRPVKCAICGLRPAVMERDHNSWCAKCNDAFFRSFPDGVDLDKSETPWIVARWAARRVKNILKRSLRSGHV